MTKEQLKLERYKFTQTLTLEQVEQFYDILEHTSEYLTDSVISKLTD